MIATGPSAGGDGEAPPPPDTPLPVAGRGDFTARPLLLDLFCGAGGAAVGYHRAGFDIVGVDNQPQPHYPYTFIQADALSFPLDGYDAIHASPPCQAYSFATLHNGTAASADHPDLLAQTRERLTWTGVPYVIENVPTAPMRADVLLCGEMFGLRVHRHRIFAIGRVLVMQPPHVHHELRGARDNCHIEDGYTRQVVGHFADLADAGDAMGIDWMNRDDLAEAIPPAYTEYIGAQLMQHVRCPA